MKKISLLIGLCVLLLILTVGIYVWKQQTYKEPILQLAEDVQVVSDGYTLEQTSKKSKQKENAKDTIYLFNIKKSTTLGQLELTVRKIDNGDVFVFSKLINTSDTGLSLPLQIVFKNHSSFNLNSFEEKIKQEHNRVFGIDYTSNVKGLYTIEGKKPYQLFLSQNYLSKELVETYEDGTKSVLRELVNEDKFIDISKKKNNVTFNLKLRTTAQNQISENWFLLSRNELFSSEKELTYYKNYSNKNFIKSFKWLTATGTYTKLPWSIEPATKLGYGRNLVYLQGKIFAERYPKTKDPFYYDMLVNSVNYLFDFKGDKELWETEYTSAWLKKDYGIQAPYTDTRHNENIALFLSNAGKILKNEQIQQSDLLYANYLTTQQELGNILSTDHGYFILDYYSKNQKKKTHVSLNHSLGEMNFLLDTYIQTNDKKYLDTALSIKQAVEDTGTKWINNNNGDLWYQINADYSFEGKDYDTLTLEDLVKSLDHYKQLNLPYDEAIYRTLMESKIEYIIDQKIELLESFYNDLVDLGFGDLLKDYQHTYSYTE